ncbi:hypothetical protein GH714_012162 [Hevea brasiliensis]|uniref:F-box/kelch-repeat protein SKIP25 n=1 Tax=Hevea brasiliensis TaxID=3981 RepID=A0A6A6LFW1_HEVBR|nr:hypothetical protein GH714_012162 [Hevea brasiliensis]
MRTAHGPHTSNEQVGDSSSATTGPSSPSPSPPPIFYFPLPTYSNRLCFWASHPCCHHSQFCSSPLCPLIFNPVSRTWAFGPPLSTPRRWCAAGSVNGAIYVASGIGSHFSADVARSVEKWYFLHDKKMAAMSSHYLSTRNKGSSWKWEKVKGLKNVRFSRDAIDAVGWRGKLCMVNAKGDAAKEGSVYDTEKDTWEDMPEGMLAGWKGPVAAMDEKVMYVVDEAKGALKKYEPETDDWEKIMESERLIGAQQIAAGGGRVCVVCGGSNSGGIVVLDVMSVPVRLWVVETPPGFEAVAVHILPRMSRPDLIFPVPP